MLRRLIKTGVARALHWTGTDRLIGVLEKSEQRPLVVGYHRVVEDFSAHARISNPAMLISRKVLERQLDWIGRRYRFVSLDELGSWLQDDREIRRPVAAVTFDDGYADIYRHAWPLLKKKGIPAAVFVVTDTIGTSNLQPHDTLYLLLARAFGAACPGAAALRRFLCGLDIRVPKEADLENGARTYSQAVNSLLAALPQAEIRRLIAALESEHKIEDGVLEPHRSLSWEMIVEMQRCGITIGSHTKTHAVLTRETHEKVLDETDGSRKELQRKLVTEIRHFAYPDGRFDAPTVKAVAASGYRFAYTTCRHRDPVYPLLTIPRLLLWENSCLDARGNFSAAIMNCHINGVFDLVHSCNQAHSLRRAA
jgi:peptidoglycan/xylan/chitin deacetylase (PgdA/CDA1 family)